VLFGREFLIEAELRSMAAHSHGAIRSLRSVTTGAAARLPISAFFEFKVGVDEDLGRLRRSRGRAARLRTPGGSS
jgi:hypothetical protein